MKTLSYLMVVAFCISLTNNSFAQNSNIDNNGTSLPVKLDHWILYPENPDMGKIRDWEVDVPPTFKDKLTEKKSDGRTIEVIGKDFNGPFTVYVYENGKVTQTKEFTKGGLTRDTVYIEAPTPPYDLQMTVSDYYEGLPK